MGRKLKRPALPARKYFKCHRYEYENFNCLIRRVIFFTKQSLIEEIDNEDSEDDKLEDE